jgi:hypothetical protein
VALRFSWRSKTKSPQAAKPGGFFRSGVDVYFVATKLITALLVTIAICFGFAASGAGRCWCWLCCFKSSLNRGLVFGLHALDVAGAAVSTPGGAARFASGARTGAFFMVVPMAGALGLRLTASGARCGRFAISMAGALGFGLTASGACCGRFAVTMACAVGFGLAASGAGGCGRSLSGCGCFQCGLYRGFVSRGFSFDEAHFAAVAPDGAAGLSFLAGSAFVFTMRVAGFTAVAVGCLVAFATTCDKENKEKEITDFAHHGDVPPKFGVGNVHSLSPLVRSA